MNEREKELLRAAQKVVSIARAQVDEEQSVMLWALSEYDEAFRACRSATVYDHLLEDDHLTSESKPKETPEKVSIGAWVEPPPEPEVDDIRYTIRQFEVAYQRAEADLSAIRTSHLAKHPPEEPVSTELAHAYKRVFRLTNVLRHLRSVLDVAVFGYVETITDMVAVDLKASSTTYADSLLADDIPPQAQVMVDGALRTNPNAEELDTPGGLLRDPPYNSEG